MANKNTIEPRAIEDTVECIEALAEIVKKKRPRKAQDKHRDL